MKICFFAHNSKNSNNGAILSLINIANELIDRGFSVTILYPNKNMEFHNLNKKIELINIPSYSMRTRINDFTIKNKVKEIIKIIRNKYSIKMARKLLKKSKPDIIHINGIDSEVGAKVARKIDVPYIWHIRQLLEEDFGMRLHNKKEIYKLLKMSNFNIAISKTVQEKYSKLLNQNISLIFNGIPLNYYEIKGKEQFHSNETINILLAGRIVEQKGQLEAVKAIKHLVDNGTTNVKLILIGDFQSGNYINEIKKYINNHSLNQYITIKKHAENLKSIRRECDIGLICSKNEAFGRVTIETMASSMLVIGANTGGTAEIISDNYNGLLYEEGNHISLANRIKYAIDNKDEVNNIIKVGYQDAITNYSITNVVDQIVELYKETTR